jgi:transcriptional regulator with XRE-family HTH domain/predicted Fe-Mo cluster-binding NifX family protein
MKPHLSGPLSTPPPEQLVGQRLRALRTRRGLSLRVLADASGLNINTLSLIENGKSSPSVSTLQQLATALDVPIASFFEAPVVSRQVVLTRAGERGETLVDGIRLEHLGEGLADNAVQPMLVHLPPEAGSGDQLLSHTGHEFVYCLAGSIQYQIGYEVYTLQSGDSLVFLAHQPHCWKNPGTCDAQMLLVVHPVGEDHESIRQHFTAAHVNKELTMKIALITDDGETISQHFGRALYYLVLSIDEGVVVERELREKPGHRQFSQQVVGIDQSAEVHDHDHHHDHQHGQGHGMNPGSHQKHLSMAEVIADCQVLLCGGMGRGAYESMLALNIQPVVTELRTVDEAIRALLEGRLVDHTELLH